MHDLVILQRGWKDQLAELLGNAEAEVLISSPYITTRGVNFVKESISPRLRKNGLFTILTDLSPINVSQGSTDPSALIRLTESVARFKLWHLPRLHAKVYVADTSRAIITSGNLTSGGLSLNYEYGIRITDAPTVRTIKQDILDYAALGANINTTQLFNYKQIADELRQAAKNYHESVPEISTRKLKQVLQEAEDVIIRLRLSRGAPHSVFSETILYLLERNRSLTTEQLHSMIEEIHPDLCDNSVDRVIDGMRFGKKWKHAVRTSQQHLKRKNLIRLAEGRWMLVEQEKRR